MNRFPVVHCGLARVGSKQWLGNSRDNEQTPGFGFPKKTLNQVLRGLLHSNGKFGQHEKIKGLNSSGLNDCYLG